MFPVDEIPGAKMSTSRRAKQTASEIPQVSALGRCWLSLNRRMCPTVWSGSIADGGARWANADGDIADGGDPAVLGVAGGLAAGLTGGSPAAPPPPWTADSGTCCPALALQGQQDDRRNAVRKV